MGVNSYLSDLAKQKKDFVSTIQVDNVNYIPSPSDARLQINKWLRIDEAVAVYADIVNSTGLSANVKPATMAKVYEIVTGSWISILKRIGSPYIDVKGDGGFGLFYGKAGLAQAMLAAITFQSIVNKELSKIVDDMIKAEIDWTLKIRVGIHKGILYVKRVGEKNVDGQQLNWMVWSGKAVNYAAKLASTADDNSIFVTEEIYQKISETPVLMENLVMSCGCPDGTKRDLWVSIDESHRSSKLTGLKVYKLTSTWCKSHGDQYFENVADYVKTKAEVVINME